MWQNAHETYLEGRILAAEPLELVRMLYGAAVRAVCDARRHLASGEIRERAAAISRTLEILMELDESLDRQRGGEISLNLARLYDYMRRKLIEANFQQVDEPLAEVLSLLTTLSEAWEGIRSPERGKQEEPGADSWTGHEWTEPETVGCGSRGWSL